MEPEIWIYGHWLSCNMGDRFQARGVAKYLSLSMDISKLVFVNFSKDTKPMSVELNGVKYPVYGPEDVKDRSPRLIILVTGSIDYMAKFIPWIKNQLDKDSLDEVIIWGGFGHGRKGKAHRDGLDLFLHPKITFWSRSWRDADMFQEWFGRPSRLAGDPMAFWVLNDNSSDKTIEYENIVIPSIYAWRYHPEVWEEMMKKADRVISIDNVADYKLKASVPQIEFINDPTKLIPILHKTKNVISGRLHGGLLSALMDIPTAMVVTDDAAPGEGTYKFEAVARTGCGPNKPLCAAPCAKDLSLPLALPSEKTYSREYLDYTAESLLIIKDKVKRLYQHHRIAILAWYDTPLDQIKVAIEEFERQGHQAISVDAVSVFTTLNTFQPDVILIWNRHQGVAILPQLRSLFKGKIIFFNWDDPHAVLRSDLLEHIDGLIDHVFSTCRSTEKMYLEHGAGGWTYLPPFYSKKWHYPEVDEKYQHDVAMVCTNFYKNPSEFPGQLISRYDLIKALNDDPEISFGLYGPESFRAEFPHSYCGQINYADNHKVFASSKINISTHVENGDGYTNERCITILGSGGLLLVDPIQGWQELFGDGCVVMRSCDAKDVISQIKEILSTYHPAHDIIKQHGSNIVKKYEVKEWAKAILSVC